MDLTVGETIAISSIFVTISLVAIPFIWKKYTDRPENTIEIKFNGGSKRTQGLSRKNKSGASAYAQELVHVYNLKWDFDVIIRNNSDVDSYYTKIEILSELDGKINLLNEEDLNTLKKQSELTLKCNYQKQIETTPHNSPDMRNFPEEFNTLKILLFYNNSYRTKFFTLFENGFQNQFLRRNPKN